MNRFPRFHSFSVVSTLFALGLSAAATHIENRRAPESICWRSNGAVQLEFLWQRHGDIFGLSPNLSRSFTVIPDTEVCLPEEHNW